MVNDHEKVSEEPPLSGDSDVSENANLESEVLATGENVGGIIAENAFDMDQFDPESFQIEDLENIPGRCHAAIAEKLIGEWKGYWVTKNLEKFEGLDHSIVVEKLISRGNEKLVVNYLEKFEGLDHSVVVEKLISRGNGGLVVENLEKFEGLDHSVVVEKLISRGNGGLVVENLEKFEGLDHSAVVEKLISRGGGWFVVNYLEKFEGLDHSVVFEKLISTGGENLVADNLEKFEGLDHSVVFEKLISTGNEYLVTDNFEKFEGLDHSVVFEKLISIGGGWFVVKYLEKFEGLDHSVVVEKLISSCRSSDRKLILENLEKFEGLNHVEIARMLIEKREGNSVLENLEKFEGLTLEFIFFELISSKEGYLEDILHNIACFRDLEGQIEEEDFQNYCHSFLDSPYLIKDLRPLKSLFAPEIQPFFEEQAWLEDFHFYEIGSYLYYRKEHPEAAQEISRETMMASRAAVFEGEEGEENGYIPPHIIYAFGGRYLAEFIGSKDWNYFHVAGDAIDRAHGLSGLSVSKFFGQILMQVKMDTSSYGSVVAAQIPDEWDDYVDEEEFPEEREKDSYDYFHEILQNVEAIQEELPELLDFMRKDLSLSEVVQEIEAGGIFASWKILKQMNELYTNKETLRILSDFQGNRREFAQKLLLHPNISTASAVEFLERPEAFFDVGEDHGAETHERKKPSHYMRFAHLDLTAEQLRDALMNGDLDRLQYFPAYAVEYTVRTETFTKAEFVAEIFRALGRFREKISGQAQDPKKLFGVLNPIFKAHKITIKDLDNDPGKLTPKLRECVEVHLYGDLGVKDPRKTETYRAEIYLKSDPMGLVAGNDTACCMPFGAGKQNVYMCNLTCAQMTLQRKNGDNKWKTLAQSVLTPDMNVGQSAKDLAEKVMTEGPAIHDEINKDLAAETEVFLTADNIECAKNGVIDSPLIEKLYADFFARYGAHLQKIHPKVNTHKLIVGKNYTGIKGLSDEPNHYVPLAPPGYSDNLEEKSYVIRLQELSENHIQEKEGAFEGNVSSQSHLPEGVDIPKGLRLMTSQDVLKVAYLEGKIYADNESLIQYIHRIGNEIIASEIANQVHGRQNISLVAEDKEGGMQGYMLAYAGVLDKEVEEPQACIYISDLAAGKNKIAGGKLMRGFIDLVKNSYPKHPIIMEARDQTSYQVLQKQAERYGYKIEEFGTYQDGSDTMHNVALIPEGVEIDRGLFLAA